MNRNSVTDYLSCILFKALGFFVRRLPCSFSFLLGRLLGRVIYFFDSKHRNIAYANIKTALGNKITPSELNNYLKDFYRSFGQTLIEFFIFPLVDKKYLDKYITFEGLDNIAAGFKRGKGVILSVVHEGSWEVSNIISANLGYPFSIVVRDQQKYSRLNNLLNLYRSQKGTKLIETKNQTKKIIETLKKNEAIAMTVDQGGKSGSLVKFFGRNASMSTGAVRLALKLGATIIPVFSTRAKGPYIKFIIERPFEIKETGDREKDVDENLQRLISIFEKYIEKYPKEYLWTYKIWKYTNQKNILILSDAKTGHLRQSQAVADIISGYFEEKGISINIETAEVRFKNRFAMASLALCSSFAGRYHCQGCIWCLKVFLEDDTYKSLIGLKPDIIVSCGSSVACVNFILSRENLAKSIVIMRPSVLSAKKFDLVIMNRHDGPPKRKNIAAPEGALNLINDNYLKSQAASLGKKIQIDKEFVLGLLVGGDNKDFRLNKDIMREVVIQIKSALEKLDGQVLVSTSRRTNNDVESLLKEEFKDYPRCKLLVIANERNIPEAVGGILGLSRIVVTTPESISMISEAVNSKKYVLVFNSENVSAKHKRFLNLFARNKYIYLDEPCNLNKKINDIWRDKPEVFSLKDNFLVGDAIKRIL